MLIREKWGLDIKGMLLGLKYNLIVKKTLIFK